MSESGIDVALWVLSLLLTDTAAVYASVNTNPVTVALPLVTIEGAGDCEGFVVFCMMSVYTYPAAFR
jgi:hypothetical protein